LFFFFEFSSVLYLEAKFSIETNYVHKTNSQQFKLCVDRQWTLKPVLFYDFQGWSRNLKVHGVVVHIQKVTGTVSYASSQQMAALHPFYEKYIEIKFPAQWDFTHKIAALNK
jgi:hypothetical protein